LGDFYWRSVILFVTDRWILMQWQPSHPKPLQKRGFQCLVCPAKFKSNSQL
jgi:hypothetical protein